MTTTPAQIRAALGQALKAADLADVHTHAPTGVVTMPCIVLGMPRWRAWAEHGMDLWECPIVVCVAMQGADPAAAVDQLDQLWPEVVALLQDLTGTDQTLGGICNDSAVSDATFGSVKIGAQDYPSYHINLKIYST